MIEKSVGQLNQETAHTMTETTMTFEDLGVHPSLVDALAEQNITEPFAIQTLALPDAMEGLDICGKAQTGSGKTLAFCLPILTTIAKAEPMHPTALVLVPTRELANQVVETIKPLAKVRGRWVTAVYGGTSMDKQINEIAQGTDVIIATPGRLIDLLERKKVKLDEIEIVAIDEADQMADMGFLPQVRRILREVNTNRQTMLFSATLDGQVGSLIKQFMNDPVNHEVESSSEPIETMEHRFLKIHYMDKTKTVAAIAETATRVLVFVRTKHMCDRVADDLKDLGVEARAIHGDLPQPKRERSLKAFMDGKAKVLVGTNVAARGLHIDGVDIVVHFDPPDDPKTYLHRSGRTARAGESGLVVTLVEWDQVNEVLGIQREAGLDVPIIKMFSNDPRLRKLMEWEPDPEEAPFRLAGSGGTRNLSGRRRRRRM
ncbi:ATP-dependent RNA helicase RhlB [hydrothermal vent metagenome]|uniref:ATP-dependent RNA helicase RhlB n=1 Tax=hydrothermal vent metagenome TaxID=652676 RepID=A0A3B0RXC4_9ZZZZ